MNSLKLLQFFDYNWDELLPQMLETDPKKRPLRLAELASCLRRKDRVPRGNPLLKRMGMAILVALAAAGLVFLARRIVREDARPVDPAKAEFDEAFGPGGLRGDGA